MKSTSVATPELECGWMLEPRTVADCSVDANQLDFKGGSSLVECLSVNVW